MYSVTVLTRNGNIAKLDTALDISCLTLRIIGILYLHEFFVVAYLLTDSVPKGNAQFVLDCRDRTRTPYLAPGRDSSSLSQDGLNRCVGWCNLVVHQVDVP